MLPPSSIMRRKSRSRTATFWASDSPKRSMNASGSATNDSRSAFLLSAIARLFSGRALRERLPANTTVPGISAGFVGSSTIERPPYSPHPMRGQWSRLVEPGREGREQRAGVVDVDRPGVGVRQKVDLVDDRLEVVEVVPGVRVHGRATAGPLGAEHHPLGPDDLEQQFQR